jgi:predicted nuclease of predicted toxin-antitoxin system
MKFLLDENVDYRLASFLSTLGYDVKAIPQDYPYGLFDHEVLAIAYKEKRILITNDKDFGELIFRRHLTHRGVILFRLKKGNIDINTRKERLRLVLEEYTDQLHHFVVITEERVRVGETSPSQSEEKAA